MRCIRAFGNNISRDFQTRFGGVAAAIAILLVSFPNGVLLALSPEKAITQYGHDIWTSENGLPQNSVLAITQTRGGYLWLGTEEGLIRFDGVSFTIFDKGNTDEIKDNRVSVLHEDQEGNLWIGTRGGLNRFKNGKFTSYTTKDGLSKNFIWSIYGDRERSLWIGTAGGLDKFKDGKFTTFTTKEGCLRTTRAQFIRTKKGVCGSPRTRG